MDKSNKFIELIKNSVSKIFSNKPLNESKEDVGSDIDWSANEDTIVIKKADYESLINENFNKTEVIKNMELKTKEAQSIIDCFEDTFSMILKKDFLGNKFQSYKEKSYSFRKLEEEIEKLKTNESRLKSHIQALKRDLLIQEKKLATYMHITTEKLKIYSEKFYNEERENKILMMKIDEYEFNNKDLSCDILLKCKELAEVIEYCKLLYQL